MKINVHDSQEGFKFQVESASDPRLGPTEKSAVREAINFCDCICIGSVVAVPAHLDH